MERKDFLKNMGLFGLGAAMIPVLSRCSTDDASASGNTNADADCTTTPSETAGPFPTHDPASLAMTNIRGDRTGVPLEVNITLTDSSGSAVAGALIDIWHCDKDGYYSEYGGSGMQSVDYTDVSFLRGRQTSDSDGNVAFTSIFPGWYSGRATHIHVHVYSASGQSLLITQIAFPEGTDSGVTLVNASTENGYTKGMSGYTTNAQDNIFSDSVNCELAEVTGSVAAGYVLEHTIRVA